MRFFAAAVFSLMLALPACAQPVEKFVLGKNYYAIEPVQPTTSGSKIEVLEVFMYTCAHCYDLEPYLVKWKATLPKDVAYTPFPAAWNPGVEAFARAFYAAETLGILEKSHEPMFDAIHKTHTQFASLEEIAQWYTQYGVTKEGFLAAANSFAVNTKVNRAKTMLPRWGVAGTPTIIVNGKYRFDVSTAGGHQNIGPLIDFLVEKERGEAVAAK